MSIDIHRHLEMINMLFTRSENILITSDRPDRANIRPIETSAIFNLTKNMIGIVQIGQVTQHEISYNPCYYQTLLAMENFPVLLNTGDHRGFLVRS
jgi:hypothetical protein